MTDIELLVEEQKIRAQQMRIRRRNEFGQPYCDMCGVNIATERHHIIPKYATINYPEARKLANKAEITAALCHECHETADIVENRNALFRKLYVIVGRNRPLFGYYVLKTILDEIKTHIPNLPIDLPEVNGE